jgi:hypothetical protein
MNNLIKEKPSKLDHVEETLSVVVAGVSPAVEPWRPARRINRTPTNPVPFAWALRFMESSVFPSDLRTAHEPVFFRRILFILKILSIFRFLLRVSA